jgi:hypothetical protein
VTSIATRWLEVASGSLSQSMSRKITRETLREGPEYSRCDSTGWVCENHSDRPWDGAKACGCGGAGMPRPSCNVSAPDNPPRLPEDFQRDESLDHD